MPNTTDDHVEAIGQAADRVRDKAAEVSQHLKDAATDKYNEVRDRASDAYNQGRETAEQWEQSLEGYVQEKPLQAVLLAAGVGLLLGLLWKRS
jgi:ElaB/YqjD/DUF883 family membrane-anchored ribosome-binding protein